MEFNTASALHTVPDDELLRRLAELVSQSRRADAELVAISAKWMGEGSTPRPAVASQIRRVPERKEPSIAEEGNNRTRPGTS